MQCIYIGLAFFMIFNGLIVLSFVIHAKLPDGKYKQAINKICYELDRIADNMSNQQKRAEAINQVRELLGWKQILIPSCLIGWVLDSEVAIIRQVEQKTDTSDLHQEDGY